MHGGIILDTNSLIYAIKNRVDLRGQIMLIPEISDIFVPECVIRELQMLKGRIQYSAGALTLAQSFKIIDAEGNGDDCIIQAAKKTLSYILTNDRGLIDRARNLGIRTFSILRGKKIGVTL